MGNRTHCDRLVTTVCMLCILCTPHSHCSLHDPQLPRASFHHHGRAKMSRPPDATDTSFGEGPLAIWDYHENLDTKPLTKVSAYPTNDTPLRPAEPKIRLSGNSGVEHLKSKHFVPHKRSASSKVDVVENDHIEDRRRRSGDSILPSIATSDSNSETSVFLEEIFKEFGDGKVITLEGFKKMLLAIEARKPKADPTKNSDAKKASLNGEVVTQQGIGNKQGALPHSCPSTGLNDGKMMFKLPKNLTAPYNGANGNTSLYSSQWHCMTAPEILTVANVRIGNGKGEVNRTEFLHHLCPALVYGSLGDSESWIQDPLPSPSLNHDKGIHSHGHPKDAEVDSMHVVLPSSDSKVWLYASLSVIIISLCGLLGVAVIPVMQQVYYHQLLQFLVALGVGTLCGDALLHLLPHAMSPSAHHDHGHNDLHLEGHDEIDNHDINMWRGFGAMLGLVFFFTTERCLILVGDWRKKRQRRKKPIPSRVRVMREAGPSSAVESGLSGQVLNQGTDVLLGTSACGGSSPRLPPGSNSVGEKLCKHKYSSYPYCYGEITTGEIVNDSLSAAASEEKPGNQDKKSRQRRRQNGCSESIGEASDDKLEKLMVRDGSSGFVKSPIEAIGRGYLEGHSKENEAAEEKKEDEEDEEGGDGGNSYTVILREHERPHHGHSHTHGHVHSAPESISSVAWMVIMGDGLHNLTDGMAIGAAFAAGIAGGCSTAVAVFCHELPHELGDFAVLLKAGMTAKQAVFYNLFSSLLCYLGMILGIFMGDTESATQWVFAVAAGMFLYIALVDMIPELTTSHSKEAGSFFQSALQFLGLICGVGVMLLIAFYEHDLKGIFSG